MLYTLATWIALSRVFIGVHYFTDAVLGAILGIVFPYLVRDRFAARRWLFEYDARGGYRLRGLRTQAWLGWPRPMPQGLEVGQSRKSGAVGRRRPWPDASAGPEKA